MKSILYTLLFFAILGCHSRNQTKEHVDILIINGEVIDGSGSPAQKLNLAIRSDSIYWMGKEIDHLLADTIIDAEGKVVTPGFIDPHAHGGLQSMSQFENFLRQGITTIALGQDGSSIPPQTFDEFALAVDSLGSAVNILTFIGHGTLRKEASVPLDQEPTEEQLNFMKEMLAESMKLGAFGMTTGLEYIPGYYSKEPELFELAKVVGEHDGLIMSHMRNEDENAVDNSVRELIRQGQFCRVQVSHMKVVYGKGDERAEQLLSILDSGREAGIDIRADIYPYTASYTGIGIVFPEWAKPPNDYEQVRNSRRDELFEYLVERVTSRNGPQATLLGTHPWAGKSLQHISDSLNKHFADVLIDDIGPGGASGAYFVMDETLQERLIQYPYSMVCTDGSPTMHHPRGYGSFAKIIEEYVLEKNLFPLEVAIRKMTGLTAESIGLVDRGILEKGMKADILVFDPENIRVKADFISPHMYSEGFDTIVLNGEIVIEDGLKKGKFLRKSSNFIQ